MTWRHPSITYGAVEPEATSPPPGRRRAAGWAATIIGVGLRQNVAIVFSMGTVPVWARLASRSRARETP